MVPLKVVDGLPTIDLLVNGRGLFRFVVDTGQPFALSVTPEAAQAMGLKKTGEMLVGDPSGAAPLHVPTFAPVSLGPGAMTFGRVEASAAAMRRQRRPDVSGTIGIGLFDGLMVTIDFGRAQFSAMSGALPPANGRDVVEASVDKMGLLSVPISIGTTAHQVDLDTGNGRAPLLLPADAIGAVLTRGDSRTIGVANTITQRIQLRAVDLADPVHLGTVTLNVSSVAYASAGPKGNLGSAAFAGMALTIDTVNHRVRLTRSG